MADYTLTEEDLKELCDSLKEKFSNKARKTGNGAYNRAGDIWWQRTFYQVFPTGNIPAFDLGYDNGDALH